MYRRSHPSTLYCTGYWRLPGNLKRSFDHYTRLLPRTLRMITGCRLHLYCAEDTVEEAFRHAATRAKVQLTVTRLPLAGLPEVPRTKPILASCAALVSRGSYPNEPRRREKTDIHLFRDYMGSGPEVFGALLAVWLSKPVLTARVAAGIGAGFDRVAWIDASVAKFIGRRSNWDFTRQDWPSGRLGHYASPMRHEGRQLPLNASFLEAAPPVWLAIERAYADALDRCCRDGRVHDEETVLAEVVARHPGLFHTIGRPARGLTGLPWRLSGLRMNHSWRTPCS